MEELNSSDLGTKEYWDNHYKLERKNFEDHGEQGDIWFGEESMDRIIRWFERTNISENSSILDLGCGNGEFLLELKKNGYTNLFGVDYSQDAINLATDISVKEKQDIKYEVLDILTDNFSQKYDIVHDKGTYDAISLSPDSKNSRNVYKEKIYNVLEDGGLFVITSCNWTQNELETFFSDRFKLHKVIPTPKFSFGGQTGNTVTSLVFQKILYCIETKF